MEGERRPWMEEMWGDVGRCGEMAHLAEEAPRALVLARFSL